MNDLIQYVYLSDAIKIFFLNNSDWFNSSLKFNPSLKFNLSLSRINENWNIWIYINLISTFALIFNYARFSFIIQFNKYIYDKNWFTISIMKDADNILCIIISYINFKIKN